VGAYLPSSLKAETPLLNSMTSLARFALVTILKCLSDVMHLEPAVRFENYHHKDQPSQSVMTLLHYPQNSDTSHIGHNKHTDIGTLTMVLADQWGLQVYSPQKGCWAFVEPHPRTYAVINVGDTLRSLSGKRLHSCVHRVVPIRGETQEEDRYSIGYFLRAAEDLRFEGSDGRKVTAKEWHDDKFHLFTEPNSKQDQSPMLTGGMEHIYGGLRPV
jgi:isopenicillin N synthase-like dioxygenase